MFLVRVRREKGLNVMHHTKQGGLLPELGVLKLAEYDDYCPHIAQRWEGHFYLFFKYFKIDMSIKCFNRPKSIKKSKFYIRMVISSTKSDPASNPESKPQRLGATNCKSSTSDKLQTFRTIFGISCKFLTKNYLHEITLFVLF